MRSVVSLILVLASLFIIPTLYIDSNTTEEVVSAPDIVERNTNDNSLDPKYLEEQTFEYNDQQCKSQNFDILLDSTKDLIIYGEAGKTLPNVPDNYFHINLDKKNQETDTRYPVFLTVSCLTITNTTPGYEKHIPSLDNKVNKSQLPFLYDPYDLIAEVYRTPTYAYSYTITLKNGAEYNYEVYGHDFWKDLNLKIDLTK